VLFSEILLNAGKHTGVIKVLTNYAYLDNIRFFLDALCIIMLKKSILSNDLHGPVQF
jgi:hypothetical protein